MVYNTTAQNYYDWLVGIVWNKDNYNGPSYNRFFSFLFNAKFFPIMDMDNSRVNDAIEFRYTFADHYHIPYAAIASDLNTEVGTCNMLEMMVALATRMENHIMSDEAYGDRTAQWFWQMALSLGFENVDDTVFDESRAAQIIDIFNNRQYAPNGKGGLFTVENSVTDMRTLDIWYQMQFWINTNYVGGI